MKLLFDQNLSFRLCRLLDDLSVRCNAPGWRRLTTVWQYASVNDFTLVSLDADFAEMATLLGPPPKVIWLRCGNQRTAFIENLLRGPCRDHYGLRARCGRLPGDLPGAFQF